MWAPLYLLFFLRFINAANADSDPLTQIAQAFFKEDFFYAHLKSEFVNASISPCDNFYRRICPKDFPEQSGIWNKLVAQIEAIMNINDFMSPLPQDYKMQRINATAALDETNYTDARSIATAINRLESLDVFKGCLVPDDKYFRLLPAALMKDRTTIINAFALKMQKFINFFTQRVAPYIKNLEDTILVERTIRMLVQREGIAHESARDKIESIISNIIDEYLLRVRKASWSSKEDRFGQTRGIIVTQYIRNVSFAISFANRYSTPENTKNFIAATYRNLFLREHELLFDLSHMPRFRNTCANFKVFLTMLEHLTGGHKSRMTATLPRTPVALSLPEQPIVLPQWIKNNKIVASIVINQVFSTHASLSATDASLIGFTGYVFAHELYHQVQFAFGGKTSTGIGYIEDLSDHLRAEQCVIDHYASVCSRFNEKVCASAHTVGEDAADVFGVQIAFAVAQKMLGNDIDKIVFPDLNMTNRELFYYAIGINWCSVDERAQWAYKPEPTTGKGDVHNGIMYRVNGLLAQLPDFARTFGCYDDDRMVFPEKSMCPAL